MKESNDLEGEGLKSTTQMDIWGPAPKKIYGPKLKIC